MTTPEDDQKAFNPRQKKNVLKKLKQYFQDKQTNAIS